MEKTNPFPVTRDNFSLCWEYIDTLRGKAHKKAAVAAIAGFLTNLFFLLSVVFFANGLLCVYTGSRYAQFLRKLSFFYGPWQAVSEFLGISGASFPADGLKLLAAAYGASILLFAALTGVIWLIYHPRRRTPPGLSHRENTAALAQLVQEGRDFSYKTRIGTSRVAMVLSIAAVWALFFAYALELKDATAIAALLSRFPTPDASTNALLYVLAAYFVIDWISSLLLLLTRFLYRFEVPYALLHQSAAAALLATEEYTGLEPRDLAQKAAALCQEALELEQQSGYVPAMERYYQAALLGNPEAMEYYARHCLIQHRKDSARYWLDTCLSSGSGSQAAKSMQRRLRLKLRHRAEYLHSAENQPASRKWKQGLKSLAVKLFSLVLALLLTVGAAWGVVNYFAQDGQTISFSAFLSSMLGSAQDSFGHTDDASAQAAAEDPGTMTLSETGTKWENCCNAYHSDGSPVIYRYRQEAGGDLTVPCSLPEGYKLWSAGIYSGNQWDIRKITQHVSWQDQMLLIHQDFLTGHAPGEYFIILQIVDAAGVQTQERYIPLILEE